MTSVQALKGWTAHNIVLPDGRRTAPTQPVLADYAQTKGFIRSTALFAPILDPARPPRLVDLGCLEGGYAVEFARAGYEVLGIEARRESFERCEYVQGELELENLSFVQDDVHNLADYGAFDVVFCCGLYYHLNDPIKFLELVSSVTSRLLLLHTHYATREPQPRHGLSELSMNEGRLGRWYSEHEIGATKQQMEANAWASWENSASFWVERGNLLSSIQSAGFASVFEQFDWLDDITNQAYVDLESRSLFVGVKD